MNNLNLVGRIVFGLVLIIFGVFHFMKAGDMAGMIPDFMPAREILVYVTGAALILAAISGMAKIANKAAGLLLALMLLLFIIFIHAPGLKAEATKMMAMTGILKDLGFIGAALMIASYK